MFKKFCPLINSVCSEGHPNDGEELCNLWDPIYGECSYSQSLLFTCQTQRMMLDPTRQLMAKKLKATEITHLED